MFHSIFPLPKVQDGNDFFEILEAGGMEYAVHEISAGYRSLSSTISCVTDRIRFLPVTHDLQVFKFQWYISYTEDRHELRMAGAKCRLLDTMFCTGEIFISGAEYNKPK